MAKTIKICCEQLNSPFPMKLWHINLLLLKHLSNKWLNLRLASAGVWWTTIAHVVCLVSQPDLIWKLIIKKNILIKSGNFIITCQVLNENLEKRPDHLGRFLGSTWNRQLKFSAYAWFMIFWSQDYPLFFWFFSFGPPYETMKIKVV